MKDSLYPAMYGRPEGEPDDLPIPLVPVTEAVQEKIPDAPSREDFDKLVRACNRMKTMLQSQAQIIDRLRREIDVIKVELDNKVDYR